MNRTNTRPGARRDERRRYYSRYIAYYSKKHNGLLILGGLFLLGVVLGTFLLRTAEEGVLDLLMRMVEGQMEARRGQSLMQNFLSGASSSLLFLAILLVCGFCAVAQPAIGLLPVFRGLGVGFAMASLYAAHGTAAAGYVALLMLPGTLLSAAAILICCRESLRLSNSFFSAMTGREQKTGNFYSPKIFLARYFSCAMLCLISAFLEAVLYAAFADFFILV